MRVPGIALMICLGTAACGATEPTAARPANTPAAAGSPTTDRAAELGDDQIAQRLRDQYAGRLAGLYLDRERDRIVVRLTGAAPVAPETHTIEGRAGQVVFETGARNSLAELNDIMASSAAKIEAALPKAHARYLDERTGEIVILVDADDAGGEAKEAELAQSLGAPVGAVGAVASGGAALAGGAAAAARGGAAMAGGASTAYSLGAAGQSGASGVTSGLGGVARAGGSAAVSPLRRAASRAAESMRSSFNAGGKAAFEATGGSSTTGAVGGDAAGDSGGSAAPAAAGGPPAWAQRMRRSQRMTHAVQATAHAVRSGDAHGGGSSVNLSEGDR